ncbi:MAG: LamB/YcsF family protein, partial [Armatimonadetes bacterium]|nr:LamB/YcsF family protein [Armatimonadota bacterium]
AVIAGAVRAVNPGMIVVALAGSMAETFERMGLRVAREAFIDREYTSRGTLVPRDQRNALLTDPHEAAFRAVRFARDGKVIAVDGTELSVQVDTLCIHSDTPGAALFARAARRALNEADIEIVPMNSIV